MSATGLTALAVAGCGGGGSQPTAQGPCSTQARAEIARAAGTASTATDFTAPSGAPSCKFVAGRLG
ncbi:MAG: hypothetical protein LC749_14005, partial [Actinobacteria bacterium]|nr:hypothetical protein [Actinomycetota bacterium]